VSGLWHVRPAAGEAHPRHPARGVHLMEMRVPVTLHPPEHLVLSMLWILAILKMCSEILLL